MEITNFAEASGLLTAAARAISQAIGNVGEDYYNKLHDAYETCDKVSFALKERARRLENEAKKRDKRK